MNAAVIAAGGSGERFGEGAGKQLALVDGVPLLTHTLLAFDACPDVDVVVVVTHPGRVDEYRRVAVEAQGVRKVVAVVAGGATRVQSVRAGLAALPEGVDLVAVHDGARAAITPDTISRAFHALASDAQVDGVVVGHPCVDTIKEVDATGRVVATPDRNRYWMAQTPQVFRAPALARAYWRAGIAGFEGTDDAALVEAVGGTVMMLDGPRTNLKVTVPEDLDMLAAMLTSRQKG
ncbi:MAG TPA: 2-C-methyl-D-erythritol 4-phosphate cytidylyltransferase [Coriobacteriia bacterium]